MEKISPELDYSTKINNHSSVAWRDIAPQGNTEVTLSSTGSVGPSEFLISPVCMNFADSRLEFKLSFGAPATAGDANVVHGDLLSVISRITLYDSATNSLLVDVNNFDKYINMMKYSVSKNELLTKPYHGEEPATTEKQSKLRTIEDKQKINDDNGNFLYGRQENADDGQGQGDLSAGAVDVSAEEPYDGLLFTYIGAVDSASIFDVSIPLRAFKGTVLALEQQIYNPTNLVLQIYWNATNNYGGSVTLANKLTTLPDTALLTPKVKDLNLVLNTEANPEIISRVIGKVMSSGIQFNTPYPSVIKHSQTDSVAHAFSLQLTRAYGNRLLFIMTARYNKTLGQINNHAIGKITRYNTTLNSIPMKYPKGFDVTASDDYILGNKQFIQKSIITNPDLYRQKWVHIDSFFGDKPLCEVDFSDIDGLDVSSQSSIFGWEADLSEADGACDYYVVVLGHKMVSFTSMGATIQ